MSLSVLLSSSSFFLTDYLTNKLQSAQYSKHDLAYGLAVKLDAAYKIRLNQLEIAGEHGSELWLKFAIKLAIVDGETNVELAEYYLDKNEISQSIRWYKQAIELSNMNAVLPLAKLYFDNNEIELARKTLAASSYKSVENIVFSVKVAIAQGDLLFVAQNLRKIAIDVQGQELLRKINLYKILSSNSLDEDKFSSNNLYQLKQTDNFIQVDNISCPTSLQVFATSLADLEKISQFNEQFAQHPLNDYICLAEPKYVSIKNVHCDHEKMSAIRCDESKWQFLTNNTEARYLGLLYPYGGANVHLGMLYFDRADSFDVFSHEVTHLLGFVDEYRLSDNHPKCQQVQTEMFAQNIVVLNKNYIGKRDVIRREVLKNIPWAEKIKASTPILINIDYLNQTPSINEKNDELEHEWLLGTPSEYQHEFGLFTADTCIAENYRTFKPLTKITQLEYNQVEFPREYLGLLTTHWQRYLMPSYHYNVALSLLIKGDIELGRAWLIKAVSMESSDVRKLKILQMKF